MIGRRLSMRATLAMLCAGMPKSGQRYQKRFPKMVDKKIFLSMDEYAYVNLGGGGGGTEPTLKTAPAYDMLLNETLRHTDSMTMGARTHRC